MDISIFSNLSLIAILLPFFLGLYLLFSRLSLSYVNKKILDNSNIFSNTISFLLFISLYFTFQNNEIINKNINYFSIEKFNLNFGISINENNILFLVISSALFLFFSLFVKKYFKLKKQFIFTKQRFYIYLSFLAFSVYSFFVSSNLFQSIIFLSIQTVLIFLFSYLDIFKNISNHNSIRFNRISIIGNFALMIMSLILLKYASFSQGIFETTLNFNQLNRLLDYTFKFAAPFEFYLLCFCYLTIISNRLMFFPSSCYYSFFANSSNIFYLSANSLVNNLVGIFLFLQFSQIISFLENYILYISIFLAVGILFSLIQILFEQNIKIIFGYLTSIINSIFIILFLNINSEIILWSYFIFCFIQLTILGHLFIKNKINFAKRIINKHSNFLLEKIHINLFEKLPDSITKHINFINRYIFQKFLIIPIDLFNIFATKFTIKTSKKSIFNIIKNILIFFAVIVLFAIYITLFGGLN